MEKIFNNPGLQQLAEKVFWNLDVEDLKICAKIKKRFQLIQYLSYQVDMDTAVQDGAKLFQVGICITWRKLLVF